MGGLTNAVFRAGDAVLRLPGKGTEEYIDRANEAAAAHAAAAAGVSPEVLFVDPASGVMVTRHHRRHGDDDARGLPHPPRRPARAGRRSASSTPRAPSSLRASSFSR
jgi:hypothetical protein